jgi:hypothetical protein
MMEHPVLIDKLHCLGISRQMIKLVPEYLSNRQQCVYLKQHNARSPAVGCRVGVPQGTLLGPTLWLVFVDSLQFSTGRVIKYADDTTSYFALSKKDTLITSNTPQAVEFLPPTTGQLLIDECHRWSTCNKMQLNAAKTKVINISLRKNLTMVDGYKLDCTHPVDIVHQSKLLGVYIDSHLNFHHHIKHIKLSTSRRCYGLLVLKKAGVNCDSLAMLYKAQVLPVVTHAAAAWYPYTTSQQRNTIENIQKLALRIVYPHKEHYVERLHEANVTPLCDYLDGICHKYAIRVKYDASHPLHHHIPKRPEGIRTSKRLNSTYMPLSKTIKCGKNVLSNPKYIQ